MDEQLVCPSCGAAPSAGERFCADCGMPLVVRGEASVSARAHHARKIDPRYADGPLVWAAGARNQVEAELIAGILLEEGVPSLVRRAPGFDVPDFMASGPREILVPASGLEVARAVLGDQSAPPARSASRRTRVVAWTLLALALVAIGLFMATHVWD